MFARLRPGPFAFSLLIHGSILAWVASGPLYEKPKSLYAQAIAPHASKVIWYDFHQKLPDVSPAPRPAPAEPPRAETKIASQEIVAGSSKAPHAQQFVWQPAPKVALNKDLQSPNLLALHVPRPETPKPAPKPKLFVPPPEAPKPAEPAPKVDAAPDIHAAQNLAAHAPIAKLAAVPPRKFVAPAERTVAKPTAMLPAAAPAIQTAAITNAAVPSALGSLPTPAHRDFVPPAAAAKPQPSAPLPDAPAIPESAQAAAVSMAIVGLNPTNAPAPAPEGSRNAQLSAGPQPRKTGGLDGTNDSALLTVPGLMIRNAAPNTQPVLTARAGAPTSAANLEAAARGSGRMDAVGGGPRPAAMRVSSAPDSLLNGRDTYQMMVQMPNITSYTGSWMIWFAERLREPGAAPAILSPPVPLHKVDPKYYPAAIADRVEGSVRLTAVIHTDGHVDNVELLMHLDDRLDKSSEEAISKWQFEPALRNGQPVDVDVVFEIPFRLAPKLPK
jgi:TonB family protein